MRLIRRYGRFVRHGARGGVRHGARGGVRHGARGGVRPGAGTGQGRGSARHGAGARGSARHGAGHWLVEPQPVTPRDLFKKSAWSRSRFSATSSCEAWWVTPDNGSTVCGRPASSSADDSRSVCATATLSSASP